MSHDTVLDVPQELEAFFVMNELHSIRLLDIKRYLDYLQGKDFTRGIGNNNSVLDFVGNAFTAMT